MSHRIERGRVYAGHVDPPLSYPRIQLDSNQLPWHYRGVLHEFMACDEPHSLGHLSWKMRRNHDGARWRDPNTNAKDAEVLQRALQGEQDPYLRARYAFYLAQSYRDGQQIAQAIEHYLESARMGGWQEEVYYSLYQVAALKQQSGAPLDEVLTAYEDAAAASDSRVEVLHDASRLCRINQRYQQGYDFARRGLNRPCPEGALFGHPWMYETGLLDEFAVNAYWIERYAECLDACLKVLATGKLSGAELARIVANAQYALQTMTESSAVQASAQN